MSEEPTSSLNKETGLLEDIDQVRGVAVHLGTIVRKLLSMPWNTLLMPQGVMIDLAVVTSSMQSMVQFTTYADSLRDLGQMLGMSEMEIEASVHAVGASEVLPSTHPSLPELPPPSVDGFDLSNPLVQDSVVLQQLLSKGEPPPSNKPDDLVADEPVQLPEELQKFLDTFR
jgi:hypothetical protein